MSGSLAGPRVLEMGPLIAGPFCGQLLADLAARADVLVENFRPGTLAA